MQRSPVAFGPYVITRRIARGGMAEIFRAKRRAGEGRAGQWVALKMMRPALEHEDLREQLFKREARIAAAIQHDNVVPLFEFGHELDRHYIAMEYVRGRDLSYLCRLQAEAGRESVPSELALYIGVKAAAGLGHAHRLVDPTTQEPLQIVHRDISPGNVMIGYDGAVKVLDFGVARMAESHGMHTQTGTLRGKFAYMSPEQTLGSAIDSRSDVFSLGTLLYELLTGTNPFRARTPIATLERVQRVRPVPPSRSNRSVDREIDELLARCLAKDPRRRFRDALELHEALSEFLTRRARVERADLARFMEERFAWAKGEEERELKEEEQEVALIEVVDFDMRADDAALDAQHVAVSLQEEAEQSAVEGQRALGSSPVAEDEFGVFDQEPGGPRRSDPPLVSPADSDAQARAPSGLSATVNALATGLRASAGIRTSSDVGDPSEPGEPSEPSYATVAERSRAQGSGHRAIEASSILADVLRPSMPSDPLLAALQSDSSASLRIPTSRPPPPSEPERSTQLRWVLAAGGVALAGVVVAIIVLASPSPAPRAAPKPEPSAEPSPGRPTTIAPVRIEVPAAERAVAETERESPTGSEKDLVAAHPPGEPHVVPAVQLQADPRDPPSRKPERAAVTARPETSAESEPRSPRASEEDGRDRGDRRRSKRSGAVGYLNIAARPWAEIEIDNKPWPYQTPQAGIELPAGRHVIRLHNRETGVSKTQVVQIKAGAYKTLSLDLRGP